MKHTSLNELKAVADVDILVAPMSRAERLARWIALLEAEPCRMLAPLHEIEYQPAELRRQSRSDDSPLTVAFEDAGLRAQGLKGDTVGDCMDFFGLTEREMHRTFCSCHVGTGIQACHAAAFLRPILAQERTRIAIARTLERARQCLLWIWAR